MLRWIDDWVHDRPERHFDDRALAKYNKYKHKKTRFVQEMHDMRKKCDLPPFEQTVLESVWLMLIEAMDASMEYIVKYKQPYDRNLEIESLTDKASAMIHSYPIAEAEMDRAMAQISAEANAVSLKRKRLPEPPSLPGDAGTMAGEPPAKRARTWSAVVALAVGSAAQYETHTGDTITLLNVNGYGEPIHELTLWHADVYNETYFVDEYRRPMGNLTGSVFGGYRLIKRLGGGVQGAVYEAENTRAPNRYRCAFKIVNGDPGSYDLFAGAVAKQETIDKVNGEWLSYAAREYDIMKFIGARSRPVESSPVVCAGVHGVIMRAGEVRYAFTTELMEGSLAGWLERRSVVHDPLVVMGIVFDMFKKIDVLHARGVLHMDAHVGNWLYRTKPDFPFMDIRLSDLGRACKPLDWFRAEDGHCVKRPESERFKLLMVSPHAMEFEQFAFGIIDAIGRIDINPGGSHTPELMDKVRVLRADMRARAKRWDVWLKDPELAKGQLFIGTMPKTFETLLIDEGVTQYVMDMTRLLIPQALHHKLKPFYSHLLTLD